MSYKIVHPTNKRLFGDRQYCQMRFNEFETILITEVVKLQLWKQLSCGMWRCVDW